MGRKKDLIDAHRYAPTMCWYCSRVLGKVFTTVKKNGVALRVHPTCRPEAATVVGDQSPHPLDLWWVTS